MTLKIRYFSKYFVCKGDSIVVGFQQLPCIYLAILLVTGPSLGIPFSTVIRDSDGGLEQPSMVTTLTRPDISAGIPDPSPGSILIAKTVDIGTGTEATPTSQDATTASHPEENIGSDAAKLTDLSIVDAVIAPNQTIELKAHMEGSDTPLKVIAQTGVNALPVRLIIILCKGESGCREKRQSLWRKACSGASRVSTHCFFE